MARSWAALTLALLPLVAAVPSRAAERIARFASTIVVQPDATLDVTERLDVRAEGGQIRHGIFRDIPTRYHDAAGRAVRIDLTVLDVTRDGRAEPYGLEGIDNGTRIRIGSADTTVPPGLHRYAIHYRATREIGFFATYDELYWNVTGSAWAFPIDAAEADVTLPQGARQIARAVYTGPPGAQGRAATLEAPAPDRLLVRTTAPLPQGSGLTLAVSWPKGVLAPPSGATRTLWLLRDNAPVLAAWVGLIAVGATYVYAWRAVGRDPRAGVVVPLFEPPDGLSPPALRYVRRRGLDDTGFAAAMIDLAVRRRLRIRDSRSGYTLEPLDGTEAGPASPWGTAPAPSAPVTAVPPEEGVALAALGPAPLEVSNARHATFAAARAALDEALAAAYREPNFRLNRGWSGLGILASLLVLAAVAALVARFGTHDMLGGLIGAGFACVWLTVFSIPLVARQRGGAAGLVVWVLRGVVALAVAGGLASLGMGVASGQVPPDIAALMLGLALLVGLNLAFWWLLPAPTPAGRMLLDRIEGFRLYLATAEEERLAILNPPERTPELFERYLPHAVALDCAQAWGAKFAAVLAAAGRDATQPDWYAGGSWSPSNPSAFATGLGAGLAASTASASVAPGSSSGSSGGGSSGGGGGGGGGGGW